VFYDKYVLLCKEKNISPSKAAIEVGLNKSTITYWKNSGKTPNGHTLQKLSDYFGVTIDNLLGKEKAPSEDEATNALLKIATPYAPTNAVPILGCIQAGMPMYEYRRLCVI